MVQGENTTVIEYRVSGLATPASLQLELRPLIALRDYHSLTHANSAIERGSLRIFWVCQRRCVNLCIKNF
jgi:hypothetical protein